MSFFLDKNYTPRILLVDDREENLLALKSILINKKLVIDTALSGNEALKMCLKNEYDLFIFDVQMPEMDGFQLAEYLKGSKQTKDIPILFVTAISTEFEYIRKGFESGAADYLPKPIDAELLRLKVDVFLKLYLQQKELELNRNSINSLLKAMPDTILEINNEFLIHQCYSNIPLLIPESALPMKLEAFFPNIESKILEEIRNHINNAKVSGKLEKFDFSILNEDGIDIYFELRIIKNAQKSVLVLIRDISDLISAENLLLEQNNFLQDQNEQLEKAKIAIEEDRLKILNLYNAFNETQNLAKIFSWEYDLLSGNVSWSNEAQNILMINDLKDNLDQLVSILHPSDVVDFDRYFNNKNPKNDLFTLEFRIVSEQGSIKHIWCKGKYIRDKNGRVIKISTSAQDITQRKEYEYNIAKNELVINDLMSNINEVVFILNYDPDDFKNLNLEYLNGDVIEVFGIDHVNLMKPGFKFLKYVHEEDRAVYMDAYLKLNGQQKTVKRSYRFKHGNGDYVWLEDVLMLGGDSNSTKNVLYGSVRNIDERKQAEKLSVSYDEKVIMLKEIHHRVKNNLQVITSLLSLQSSNFPETIQKNIFLDSQNRINSMAIIHEMLYQSDDFTKLDYKLYLKQLGDYLIRTINKSSLSIDFKLEVDNILINIDTAIPLGLLVNEIITNSLKYAFEGRESGIISITIKRNELNSQNPNYVMNISDDGIGYNGDLMNANHSSLGFKLILSLAKQLNGTAQKLNVAKGTSYQITFLEV